MGARNARAGARVLGVQKCWECKGARGAKVLGMQGC